MTVILSLISAVVAFLIKFLPTNERNRLVGLMKERDDNDKKIDDWENKE